MQKNSIDLIFPVRGLNRAIGYQSQPPFTTPDALNVWPFDAGEERVRGGSRHGLRKAYFTDLGNAVRMLASVDYRDDLLSEEFVDSFDSDQLGSNWSVIGSTPTMSVVDDYAEISSLRTGAASLANLNMNVSTRDYSVGMYIAPYNHAFHGVYRMYLRMDNTTPAPTTAGVIIEVGMLGDAIVASLLSYVAGVETVVDTYFGTPQGHADGNWLRASVNNAGPTVTVYWGATQLLSGAVGSHAGQRIGFGATCLDPSGRCLIDELRVAYTTAGSEKDRQIRRLFAASSGNVCVERVISENMWDVSIDTNDLTLASDKDIGAVQYGQKLYIADWSDKIAKGTDGVRGTGNNRFDSATYTNWSNGTTLGTGGFTTALADDYCLVIENATGNLINGTYAITAVAAGELTVSPNCATGASGTCSFYIARVPKIYTPSTFALSRWVASTGQGQVPTGSRVIARYRERAVLAVGNTWYMSRQGDFLDWNYGKSYRDSKSAIAGTVADAGVPGDTITALASSNEDFLLVWCQTSTWIIVGDPASTGQIRNVSETIGCIGPKAWCYGPNGEVYFLSRAGLAIMRGATASPEILSMDRVPRELRNINADLYTVSLVYDLNENRVFIFATDPNSDRSGRHWCYDVRTESFWPIYFPSTIQPTSAYYYTSQVPSDSCVILGCRDGYLRRFDRYCDTDDGTTFDSYVVYGPIALGSGQRDGVADQMIADVALLSRDVSWQLRVGDNAEESFRNASATSGTWVDGKNRTDRPRRRGNAFCLKVGRFASQTAGWAMERISVVRSVLGRRR